MTPATLTQQRQATEGALRALRDRKMPRPGEMATILAGLDAALITIRQLEFEARR